MGQFSAEKPVPPGSTLSGNQHAAARAPVPEPRELIADIEALENWADAIRKRRQ